MSTAETVAELKALHRKRIYFQKQRLRVYAALGAEIRTALGWSKDLDDKARKKIADDAAEIIEDGGMDTPFEAMILVTLGAVEPIEAAERDCEKQCRKLAKQLPVWQWVQAVKGFGDGNLAIIVGEAGNLSNYPDKSKLWKRMGLAVIDGRRQGNPGTGATAEDWIRHGYNKARRSTAFVLGDCIIKNNRDGAYRAAYLGRKAFEVSRDPDIKPIAAHRRAQRYMEKRLLRDLWRAWRECEDRLHSGEMPTAQLSPPLAA